MIKNYDAVVIGAGNGGLVASARLAKEGKKTLLIERHNLPGGFATSFVRGRFEFEASLHELCGIGPITGKSPLQKIFEEVGAADKIEWVSLDEAYRLITLDKNDKCDYVMPLGKEAFINKLEEYDPGSSTIVRKIFDLIESIEKTLDFVSDIEDFKPSMIKEIFSEHTEFLKIANYSVDEVLSAFGVSKKTRDIINGYWCYLGQPTDELNAIHYFTMLHAYLIDGAVIPKGRSHQISTGLLEAFTENGGEAWFNTSVSKIIIKDGVATGVVLDDGTQINAKAVICNASPYNAYTKLIDEKDVPEKLKKEVNARTLSSKGFAVFLGLNRTADELGLNNHTYFIYPNNDNRKCYEQSRKLETNDVQATVCLNRAIDDCSPEGTSILYMTSIFAGDEWSKISEKDYYKTKVSFAEKMIDNFEKATGIAIRDYIEEIEIATPMTYARYTDAPAGTIYGYEASKEDGIVKRIVFDMIDKGIPGLYFAGGYTTRHMGYSPSYTTGYQAANAAILQMEKEEK